MDSPSNARLRQLALELVGLKLQLEDTSGLEDRTPLLRRIRDVEVEVLNILRDQAEQTLRENDNMARAHATLVKGGGWTKAPENFFLSKM